MDVDGAQVAAEAAAWFAAHWDPDLSLGEWWDRLARSGWGFPTFSTEWFGKDLAPSYARLVDTQRREAGAARPLGTLGARAIAPLLLAHASDEQKQRYVLDTIAGRAIWCELFSEPGAGSDLASLATRAVCDGDEWSVTGQKLWASGAPFAHYGLLVARTDPDVPKRQGLTSFVLDMDQPGVEVRPLRAMTGDAEFNEVFLTDARVPHANVLGSVGGGWVVVKATLAVERTAMGDGITDNSIRPDLAQRAGDVAAAERAGRNRGGLAAGPGSLSLVRALIDEFAVRDDAVVRQDVARLYSLLEIARLNGQRGGHASTAKLMTSRVTRTLRDLALRIEGAHGMLAGKDASAGGVAQHLTLFSPAMSLMVGTDEVQRTIVGERALGLPAEPSDDRDRPWRQVRRS